jgi:hypothetical protein
MADQQQDYALLEKQVAQIEASLSEMTKRAEVAERNLEISKLDEDDRNAYNALSKEDQEKYHACKEKNCKDGLLNKGYETLEKANAVPEHIAKQLSDIQKQLDEEKTRRSAAEAAIKKSQDEADMLKFSKRANTEFNNLPGTDEEKGVVLKALHEKLAASELEATLKLLKAGNEAQGTIQAPVGKSSGQSAATDSQAIWARLVAKATEISKSGQSTDQAIDTFMKTPEGAQMYSEYLRLTQRQ